MSRRLLLFMIAIVAAGGLLIGCGGSTPAPQPPTGLSAAPGIAAVGEVVTLTGLHLGSSAGTLSLGGTPVTATSWADAEVVFTVPPTAAQGPQTVTLTTAVGSATTGLFVGVDFPSGTLESLAALALPKGTAVRLGAGTFAASSEVRLDNLSLYGRGPGSTIVQNAFPNPLYLLADDGYELTLESLTLRTDATAIVPSAAVLPASLGAAESGSAWTTRAFTVDDLAPAAAAQTITSQALAPTSYTLRGVAIEPASATPFGLVTLDPAGPGIYYPGAIHVSDVTVTGVPLAIMVAGDVDLNEVTSTGSGGVVALSFTQHAQINDLKVSTAGGGGFLAEGTLLGGGRGLTLTNSQITAVDGDITLYGAVPISMPLGGPTAITGNKFIARDTDPLDGIDWGVIEFMTLLGSADFSNNEVTAEGGFVFESQEAATRMRANTFTLGSADYPTTEFSFGVAGGILALETNHAEFLSTGGLRVDAEGGQATLTGNTVTGHSDTGTALYLHHEDEELTFTATGNTFSSFGQALFIDRDTGFAETLTARINDNVFDFPIDAAPKAATVNDFLATDGTLDARNNRWGSNTSAATVASYVAYTGTSDPDTLQVAPITQP